jgi:hypothetical protein
MINHFAMLAADNSPDLNLKAGLIAIRGLALLGLTIIFVYLTGKALLKHGKNGDTSGAFSVTGATLICLIPLAVGASVITITGYGGALLDVITKVLS